MTNLRQATAIGGLPSTHGAHSGTWGGEPRSMPGGSRKRQAVLHSFCEATATWALCFPVLQTDPAEQEAIEAAL